MPDNENNQESREYAEQRVSKVAPPSPRPQQEPATRIIPNEGELTKAEVKVSPQPPVDARPSQAQPTKSADNNEPKK